MSTDVVCVGVMVADVLADGVDNGIFDRDITRVSMVKLATGGDAFNQAINISALGYNVKLCGKVGQDGVGTYLLAEGANHHIDMSSVKTTNEYPTSISIVLINKNGERNFIGNARGTNSSLCSNDIDISCFKGAKIVSLGSLYGSLSLDGEAAKYVLSHAKEVGCITVSDMMHADRHSLEDAKLCLPYIDYFLPNFEEASQLTGKKDLNEIADTLLSLGVKNVLIKLGRDGVFIKNSQLCTKVPAYLTEPIDTTGAGDAMVSGFISGLLDNCDIVDAAKRGCAAGSIAVRSIGATGGIHSKSQLLEITNPEQH
ncbi:kinase, pfkB family protein [Trichomonas vaginalis G3]|uniref:Kinase, pfkB family protein n=1 Tax=Trichomonas vaginalis (strain ATCC PRA-98 / G3) TaxID=412133 RepID=A2DLQ3_TRIV3|nr:carbohydrate kinase protein [Trichomonas vaginalis G3]EAY18686.1 kinase, pfkB family protein [Trichomonas vaginalis G3]KAI5522585.1 carbohydrate kinase protein [Trichomonas vaginalis G3]|eukprot:XP_001579672.1 kinase, pfkB family protein [Trichomonas vaginalis G3]